MEKQVGVIGSGNFGTALSVLLSANTSVLLHTRSREKAEEINKNHKNLGWNLPANIHATGDLETVCNTCTTLFIAIPSREFPELMKQISDYLNPRHILIHCVKGFEIQKGNARNYQINPDENLPVRTMSEVIKRETNVVRVGCLSGPNLSAELLAGLPAAAVIASNYDEVSEIVQRLLDQDTFKVYRSHHIKGTEIAGAFKNIIAIATGLVNGQQLGKNLESIIITKGLREMLLIGQSLDISPVAFIGLAGVGDLVATATSLLSRNYRFGLQLGQMQDIEAVIERNDDLVEGISTTEVMYYYTRKMKLNCPVVHMVYDVIFNRKEVKESLAHIYEDQTNIDVDFL